MVPVEISRPYKVVFPSCVPHCGVIEQPTDDEVRDMESSIVVLIVIYVKNGYLSILSSDPSADF